MRIKLVFLAMVVAAASSLTACNSNETKASATKADAPATKPAAPVAAPVDDVKHMSVAEARAAFDAGKAVIIDVRTEPAYKAGHIKDAKLIALNEIAARSGELPKDKTIILYCSCSAEQTSIAAAHALKAKGVENTVALVGGYSGWKAAGYPVVEAGN